jgi:hypothetical protein
MIRRLEQTQKKTLPIRMIYDMRPQTFDTTSSSSSAAASAISMTTIPAQSIDAIAVHFARPVMVEGHVLQAGNYTISALKGGKDNPVLRFQSEAGEATSVMATREELTFDHALRASEVTLAHNGSNEVLRVERVAMEGNTFQFLLPISRYSN